MKTRRIIQFGCILCVVLIQTGFAQWAPVQGPTQNVMYLASSGSSMIAETGTGFFYSTDNGTHWSQANPGFADSLVSTFPADSVNFIIGNIYSQIPPLPGGLNLPEASLDISALVSLVTSISILYPQTNIDSMLVSLDTGSTALKVSQIMANLALYAAGVDTADILSEIDMAKILISVDGGMAWFSVQQIVSDLSLRALEKTDAYVFAGTNRGVFRASINGTDWSPANIGLANTNVHALASMDGLLFAATDGGVFRTSNDGMTWTAVNTGLTSPKVLALEAAGTNLFAGTDGGGVFISVNYGGSWTAANRGLTSLHVNALAVAGNALFAGTQTGLFAATLNSLVPPLPPQGLVVADSTFSRITIKWKRNTEADFLRYRIYRGTSPHPTIKVDSTTAGVKDTSKTFTSLTNGTRYYFRVTAVDSSGNESTYSNEVSSVPTGDLGVEAILNSAPKEYSLSQNYPNPFNPSTVIRFEVPQKSRVRIEVFNILGSKVVSLMDQELEPRYYEVRWNATASSGVYFCRMQAVSIDDPSKCFVAVTKMQLLK